MAASPSRQAVMLPNALGWFEPCNSVACQTMPEELGGLALGAGDGEGIGLGEAEPRLAEAGRLLLGEAAAIWVGICEADGLARVGASDASRVGAGWAQAATSRATTSGNLVTSGASHSVEAFTGIGTSPY